MVDKIINNTHLYTDVQSLEQLRGKVKSDPHMVAHEAAQQFESLFVQMLLKSMRDANKAFSSGYFNSDYMNYYQEFFDKQLSMVISQQGIGFAENIENNLMNTKAIQSASKADIEQAQHVQNRLPRRITKKPDEKSLFSSAKDFISSLWEDAKSAASTLNVHPGVLLAQAALETDWGKKIIKHGDGASTKNLFNIKADKHWDKDSSQVTTLEQQGDILVKQQAKFKSYESFAESFKDYVKLITQNKRYSSIKDHGGDPKTFIEGLQNAGYATDSEYANKVLAIFNSKSLQGIIKNLK